MIATLLFLLSSAAAAAEPPRVTPAKAPDWFPAERYTVPRPGDGYEGYDYGEESFAAAEGKPDRTVRGRYWHIWFAPPKGRKKIDGFADWERTASKLQSEGFRRVAYKKTSDRVGATFVKEGEHPIFARFTSHKELAGPDALLVAVQKAGNPDVVVLPPPGPSPESADPKTGLPYLKPLPPMSLKEVKHADDRVYSFCMSENGACEPHGSGTLEQWYEDKDRRLSGLGFVDAYGKALKAAGWTVGRVNPRQGFLYARYDKNGRDIWLYARANELDAADVGLELSDRLKKSCKTPVYGVNFDFDKDTLRPDAEPALEQVLRALKSQPGLSVEIGGHTDDVGDKAYNRKLSARRAEAVKAWLTSRGIAASRLSAAGYGDSEPLVKNDGDEHRARNRRVELKKPGCR